MVRIPLHQLCLVILLCLASSAYGDEEVTEDGSPFTASLSTSLYSDYMFRGFNLYDGAAIQPSITGAYDTGHGIISGNVFAHFSAEGDRQEEKFTEFDFTIDYTYQLGPVVFNAGHIWYTFPINDQLEASEEFFTAIVLDDTKVNSPISLTPTLSFYQDYDVYDYQYYELNLSHKIVSGTEGSQWNVTPYISFGFASNADKVYADNGFVQSTFGLSTTLKAADLSFIPSLNYTAAADDNAINEFWFGMTIEVTQ